MQSFIVVETDDGLTVAEVDERSTPEVEAERFGGVLVDPTPYATFEGIAYDATADHRRRNAGRCLRVERLTEEERTEEGRTEDGRARNRRLTSQRRNRRIPRFGRLMNVERMMDEHATAD